MHYMENTLLITFNNLIARYIDKGLINASTIIFIYRFPLNLEKPESKFMK